ncbi:virulence-associated E family protein [Rhizobium leguminosarum]|uniref:virulence-associated E family protein n=1 Tax=Rhizobium leguminosarum TaxID=384 RepID=UPI0013B894EA|nr:virulence-associated E family protein [Rhizobium leguminosarum]NEI57460.1 virulence-associated E family protein [Rhizobium leguminosarum]NEI86320.1 virulence-associated E family protein [Rhizobium leguminosarum]
MSEHGDDDKVVDLASAKKRKKKDHIPHNGWPAELLSDGETFKIINIAGNVARAFRFAPDLKGALALNEMSGQIEVRRPLPTIAAGAARPAGRGIDDTDAILLTEWIQMEAHWFNLTTKMVQEGIVAAAAENRFHPVRNYLDALVWDGKARVPGWMATYLGARREPYENTVGLMWLVSAVARIYQPGCQCDYLPVFEGEQGLGKSTALKILGGEWFTDAMPHDLSSKDASISLRGKWIIEIAEMASMSRADSNALKAYITRRQEDYRPPFGRYNVTEPRQSVFAGTINPTADGYLKDSTGARRFWPVKVSRLATGALERDRDQLWAEAVHHYRSGVRWWPEADFERRVFAPEQEQRRQADAWAGPVLEYIANRSEATLVAIGEEALGLIRSRIGKAEQGRITEILTAEGWRRGRLETGTRRQLFVPPPKSAKR